MIKIEYSYKHDPEIFKGLPGPADAAAARAALEEGNRTFSSWIERCRAGGDVPESSRFVVRCSGREIGLGGEAEMPKQAPFAVVVGCSDARVPAELLFGQAFNHLFVIRVAGNVMGDVCTGSLDFALTALSDSVKVVVMLGHSNCGAVAGAVDAYLAPANNWAGSVSPMLRTITQRIFVAVRAAAEGIEHVWGSDARSKPGYRRALLAGAVCLNAATAAFDLRQVVEQAGKPDIQVLYAVFDLRTYQVCMPPDPRGLPNPADVRLLPAPTDPAEFRALAHRLAELYHPDLAPPPAE